MDAASGLVGAALEVQAFCEAQGWPFCFIGGLAVLRWGEPRLTRDADLTIYTGLGGEAGPVDALLQRFPGRVADSRAFALRHRVLLLRASNGVPLDVSLGALPFEERAAREAAMEEVATGVRLRVASPGALVVFKAFANRPHDWSDIEGILARSSGRIDAEAVRRELSWLLELKGDPAPLARLEAMLERARGS